MPAGTPAFVRWTHLLTFFFLVIIVRSGLQVPADHPGLYTKVHCTPGREWLRFRGPVPTDRVWTAKVSRTTWHFGFDILFVLTGIAYAAFFFSTPWLHRLVPTDASIVPAAASRSPMRACIFPAARAGSSDEDHEFFGYRDEI